jgi:V8-like Glu-specific endopeptidase
MKKFLTVFVVIILFLCPRLHADEGMWLPVLLGDYAEAEMQRLGMKITAKDIYDINQPSLKDAVVLFGGGCTAEIISDEGLLLTNHHCGYSAIQAHSSMENNYLNNGFWAQNHDEELLNPTLKISILLSMEDVTQRVFEGLRENMSVSEKNALIEARIAAIEKEAKQDNCIAKVRPFYYGNQYFLIISEVFSDIRLVGAPPNSIGKFGGDTDNWMWPRHTADFSLFRIYADKDNKPADYSKDNVPYKPRKSLTISLKGVKEGDFTFVFGYPGTTQEYLTSWGVEMTADYENPAIIEIRQKRLEIMDRYMSADKATFLHYTAKYNGISNYWKKMIGESGGIKRLDAVNKKRESEKLFAAWVNSSDETKKKYGTLLGDFETAYKKAVPLNLAADYFFEAGIGVDLVRYANGFNKLAEVSSKEGVTDSVINETISQYKKSAAGYFKNYNVNIDKEVMASLFHIWYAKLDSAWQPAIIYNTGKANNGDFSSFTQDIFTKSFMSSEEKVNAFLDGYSAKKVKKLNADPALVLARELYNFYREKISPDLTKVDAQIEDLYNIYMNALMEMQTEKHFYPDANSTLRVAYGTVQGFKPRDGVKYDYFTTLEGIIMKEDSSVYDYVVDNKLKALYKSKDYGRYADADGNMHTCFIATNHTTGGNSGSPVLNAYGQLVGINFDRVWEGTMSDLMFEPEHCRNISLDIRYCLFLIDKYAGAGYLIDEMNIAE